MLVQYESSQGKILKTVSSIHLHSRLLHYYFLYMIYYLFLDNLTTSRIKTCKGLKIILQSDTMQRIAFLFIHLSKKDDLAIYSKMTENT